jgi:hypothetical protein
MKSRGLAVSFFAIALSIAFAAPSSLKAQGCALCRDATAGSTPQARKALRLAIPLLGIPAVGIFAGVLLIARRVKPGQQ